MAAVNSVKYDEVVMKKLTSLFFAVVSTTFLFVGAIKAAEKFDSIAKSTTPAHTGSFANMPGLPCGFGVEDPS